MAEAARHVVDWVRPDFIDLNFGCPVNKVVAKNGGSALLKDCPTLAAVAEAVVRAVAPLPVTAKIRIGWDADSVNAPRVGRLLEDLGIAAIAVHGRTRAQGYSGAADWNVIGEVASAVSIPVIGNGDLATAAVVASRRAGNRNRRRDAWTCGHERALDFSADQNLLRNGGSAAGSRTSRAMGIDQTSLPARRSGVGRGRPRDSIDACPVDGVFEGVFREARVCAKNFSMSRRCRRSRKSQTSIYH